MTYAVVEGVMMVLMLLNVVSVPDVAGKDSGTLMGSHGRLPLQNTNTINHVGPHREIPAQTQ